ncbi:MAG TPA: outer membrane lipoprotein-sorting protein [Candidatus Eisenbacteria bacterium]|nr:outer membrane lipoprotein-sorting protein [Candidatus Eisenbacteria bacterium]
MLRKTLTGLTLAVVMASPLAAQTADELVAKNIQARGGADKIKAVKSTRTTGKMVMGQGIEAPFVIYERRPNQTRMEFSFQGMSGVQAFDGKNGWAVMPFMGKKEPEAVPDEESKLMQDNADMDGPLVDYKAKGHKVELVGKEQVEGADAYKLKLTMKSGKTRNIYLDADTYLEIKMEAKRTVRGNEVDGETTYGDYKEENGLMLPHTIETGVKGAPQKQKLVLEKFEINNDLPDSLFAMPAGTKPAPADTTAKAAKTGDADGAKADAAATTDAKAGSTKAAPKSTKPAQTTTKKKP